MPELFIELFSEEIPARMQRNAAAELERAITTSLATIAPKAIETWYGPRRLALKAEVDSQVAATSTLERGPRANAPEQALTGFLRKHNATKDQLRQDGDYWVLDKSSAAVSASDLIASAMPGILRRFPWPKSMRWGESLFQWVRPLRRITTLLDGQVISFDLREGADDGHGLKSSDETEGHRFHAPGAITITDAADWKTQLTGHRVIVDAADRKTVIADRIAGLAAEKQLTVVDDPGLLDEVAGLVEWPVPHLGRIAGEHMDLPPEVMQVSMRVNQRYFALRQPDGAAAPYFAFVANIQADDNGAAIIAGNERVLRARFADARHFWDLDRKTKLADRVPALNSVTYHAKLGTQGERVQRLKTLAAAIAPRVGADPALAVRAAELAKADLTTGMVGEFPELQGVMGRYYALHDHEDPQVAEAIKDHYAPRGPNEATPSAPVSIAVALADKVDQLTGFFAVGEKPTGSGDPYALRRAALGVIRIIRENRIRLKLLDDVNSAFRAVQIAEANAPHVNVAGPDTNPGIKTSGGRPTVRITQQVPGTDREVDKRCFDILAFILERLVVQLRTDGARYDVLNAVFGAKGLGRDDDIVDLLARTDAVTMLLRTKDGADLLAAYRRAANILRIENRKDGPHEGAPTAGTEPAEAALYDALANLADVTRLLQQEDYSTAMANTARLRAPLDTFFEQVTVNATEPELRRNRLRLLNEVRSIMDQIADFSRIEG